MIQRGRKSSNAKNIVALPTPSRPRLTAPKTLTAGERAIFNETAAQHPHLKPGDAMILAAFVQASVRSFKLAKRNDTKAWEQAVRAMLALARSLRLTPISGTRAETLGRKRDQSLSYYDRMRDADDTDPD
jgi:hypothetical protein